MTERTDRLKKLLVLARKAQEDYHGERYWDVLQENQQLMIKMLSTVLEEWYKEEVDKEKKE
jgi:hypothetical protein